MQRSPFSAVSGLRNHQTRMDVIGNNIANVNTTAFKTGRATFKESFSQVLTGATRPVAGQGGINPLEVGMGMQLASIDTIFTQGNLETTGVTTDMAVQGNSFFVVGQGSNQSFFTRAGNFQLDADGRLVSPTNGFVVQGRMATNGVLGGALTDIKLPAGQTAPAKATTQAGLSGNLDSSAPLIVAADPAKPTDAELAAPENVGSVTQTSKGVYDSLGVKHDITLVAWKVASNKWDIRVDLSSLNGGGTPSTFGPGSLVFKSDGTLDVASSTIPAIKFKPAGNAADVSIKLDPGMGATGITSFATGNSALIRDQDGYTAGSLQRITVVATHLMEVLKANAADLLGRQDVQEMVETLKKTHPALVDDIVPAKISLGTLHRVLQRLLRERIPIRDLVTILEALGDAADTTKDPEALTEQVRRSLSNVIARLYAEPDASVRGITMGPRLEQALTGLFSPRTAQPGLTLLNPDALTRLLRELNDMSVAYSSEGRPVPLVTSPSLRVGVRRLIEPVLPSVPVISLAELPAVVNLHSVGMWELANAA